MGKKTKEEIREAVESGRMTPEQAAKEWPNGPGKNIVQEAARIVGKGK